jgi:hypothetical protein
VVGEIERHQRLEGHARRQRCQDARAVGAGLVHRAHGWIEIGHDHGARKPPRGVGQDRGQCITVAQVQVPVVGTGEGQACCGH